MDIIKGWLSNPTFVQIAVSIVGVIFVVVAARQVRKAITAHIEDPSARYRARKMSTLGT